ncbi:MAG: aminotransferase class III-fold pyridoxal phosphate-dependent enzyme [Alphaproteobacteria bacterium]|nr:aminotransferase class III-fold pyridoxal phosphate-dependent enzyme [Alphaproteobacteria bacterium]
MNGLLPPELRTAVPGPRSEALVDVLARRECPAITSRRARRAAALGAAQDDPIVWREAVGSNVWDADGNRFVDLTSGFGVALVGHRDPAVVAAARVQSERLIHAMGDAFPDETRIALLDRLVGIAPPGITHAILGLSGADAVDGAVKTAVLATGRPGVLSFGGGYHGLSLGTVPLQGYKAAFSDPFRAITNPHVRHLPYAAPLDAVREALAHGDIGLVLVEPIQGRGGIRVPPEGWLQGVSDAAHAAGALVAHDEIQCGLGRTGEVWAGAPAPDLLCVGKALAGGYPLSATLGTEAAMAAWGASQGEALHTQTFLGHPVGCAAALAVLDQMGDLPTRCAERGGRLRGSLEARGFRVQGRGLMLGVALDDTLRASRALLERGYIVLPAGMGAEVLALTPPVVLSDAQIDGFVDALVAVA